MPMHVKTVQNALERELYAALHAQGLHAKGAFHVLVTIMTYKHKAATEAWWGGLVFATLGNTQPCSAPVGLPDAQGTRLA